MAMMDNIKENINVAKEALKLKEKEIQDSKSELRSTQKDVRVGKTGIETIQ
jgi:hypothetical protein